MLFNAGIESNIINVKNVLFIYLMKMLAFG